MSQTIFRTTLSIYASNTCSSYDDLHWAKVRLAVQLGSPSWLVLVFACPQMGGDIASWR